MSDPADPMRDPTHAPDTPAPDAPGSDAPGSGHGDDGRVRVLALTKGLGRGGTERLLAGAARHLDRSRFDLEVAYLLPWKDAFVDEIRATGTPVHCLDAPRSLDPRWVRRLRHLVRARDIDVVHTHMPLPAAYARVALPGRRPAFVHTEHNMWGRYRPPTRWANAVTYRRNARAIAVSDGVAASIRSRVPVEVVVHGADTSLVVDGPDARAAARARLDLDRSPAPDLGSSSDPGTGSAPDLGSSSDPGTATDPDLEPGPDARLVIGSVGNFTAKKDQAGILRAVAALPAATRAAARVVLIGLGPLEDDLRALATELGLAGQVLFPGSRDDVFAVLPAFDVFVLGSRFEGLPIALLEAMASGVAPVATTVGGIPEVITDGVDGLLVPPGDPDALAAALARVLDDGALRARLGAAARARAADFDLVAAVRRTEDIYLRALGR